MTAVAGIGMDLVHIDTFASQCAQAGSTFLQVFTPRERADARARRCGERAEHESLAARWAAKEAFVKAWSAAIAPTPSALTADPFPFALVEVRVDAVRRPTLHLHGQVREAFEASLGATHIHLSLSHDGPMAGAIVVIESSSPHLRKDSHDSSSL